MGHAVPMPVVVKTRSYDEDFYAAITGASLTTPAARDRLGSGKDRRLR